MLADAVKLATQTLSDLETSTNPDRTMERKWAALGKGPNGPAAQELVQELLSGYIIRPTDRGYDFYPLDQSARYALHFMGDQVNSLSKLLNGAKDAIKTGRFALAHARLERLREFEDEDRPGFSLIIERIQTDLDVAEGRLDGRTRNRHQD